MRTKCVLDRTEALHRMRLNRKSRIARTHKIDEGEVQQSPHVQHIPDSNFSEKKSKFYNWIASIAVQQKLKAEISQHNESDAPLNDSSIDSNTYYAPEIASTLIEMFSKLPLTSFIMDKFFGRDMEVPTSSTTEAGFRVLKRSVFAGLNNIRLDTWLEKHLKYLQGKGLSEKCNYDLNESDHDSDSKCKDDLIVDSENSEYESDSAHQTDDKKDLSIEKKQRTM